MLDPTKIPLGRLAVAYGLSDYEMESVIGALGATFDYAWMKEEYNFIYPGLELFSQYDKENLKAIIEEVFQADELYYARVEGFMVVPIRSGSVFDYQWILSALSGMRCRAEEHLSDPNGMAQKYGIDPPTPEGTEHMLKNLYRDKLLLAVRDMCLVDKKSAVLFLESHDLHLQQEVKGLSRQFVENICQNSPQQSYLTQAVIEDGSIPATDYMKSLESPEAKGTVFHADMHEVEALERDRPNFLCISDDDRRKYMQAVTPHETPVAPEGVKQLEADEQQTTILVPRALWEGKRAPTVRDSMRNAGYENFVIAHVLYEWCKQGDTAVGKSLFIPNPTNPERGSSDSAHRRRSQALRRKAKFFIISTD